MPTPTRLYLQTNESEYRPLVWFLNNRPNEMLLGIYGLKSKQAILKYMWEPKEVTTTELKSMQYKWNDAEEVGLELDHMTCHADGKFHVKVKGHDDLYTHKMRRAEGLGPHTNTFLDIILFSDIARNYNLVSEKIKTPNVCIGMQDSQFVTFRGYFSGINHDLRLEMENDLKNIQGPQFGVELTSGTLKGLLVGQIGSLSETIAENRMPGTILSLTFPIGDDLWHVKTFMFQ